MFRDDGPTRITNRTGTTARGPKGRLSRRALLRGLAATGGVATFSSQFPIHALAQSKKEIVQWTFLDVSEGSKDPRGRALAEIHESFSKRTGVKVKCQVFPWQQIDQQLIAASRAGITPDLSRIRWPAYFDHVRAKSVRSLGAYFSDSFGANQRQNLVMQAAMPGDPHAVFVENTATALFLRADWLAETGMQVPNTWDEFIEVGKAFKDISNGAAGYATFAATADASHMDFIFQPMIHGRGGKVLNDDGTAGFNDKIGRETFEFLRDLVHVHKILTPDVISTTYEDTTDAFASGRAGMIIEGSHRFGRIAKALGQEKVKLAKVPGLTADRPSPCIMTGWNLAIPTGSANPDLAWELIKHQVSAESQEIWARVSRGLPVNLAALELPYFKTPDAAQANFLLAYEQTDGQVKLSGAHMVELSDILANAFQDVVLHPEKDVAAVLRMAENKYNSIISR